MKKYDISIKDSISGLEGVFTEVFLGLKIKKASKPLNLELQTIEEKEADFICKITDLNDNHYILHIEFQATNHSNMHYRMLRYWTELHKKYKLPIIQLVIYIGKKPLSMKDKIELSCYNTKIDYSYKLVDIREIDCEFFINSNNPEMVLLAILCDFDAKNKRKIVKEIIQKLNFLLDEDKNELKNKFLKLEVFSELRGLIDIVKEEEKMVADKISVEKLPSYQLGLEAGLEAGLEKGKIEGIIEVAINMMQTLHLSVDEVAKIVNLKKEILLKHLKDRRLK